MDTASNLSAFKKSEPHLSRKALLETLDDRATVDSFLQVKPYTCVIVTSWYNNQEYKGIGFSKVSWPDRWEPETGAEIAKRRALISILHQVRASEKLHDSFYSFNVP